MNRPPQRSRVGAFSLVELLTVVVVISVLVAILLPVLGSARERAQTAAKRMQLQSIGQAADAYRQSFSAYPGYVADGAWPGAQIDGEDLNANQNLVLSLMGGVDPEDGAVYEDLVGSGPITRAGRQVDAFYSPSSDELMYVDEWELSDYGHPNIPMLVDPVSRTPVFYSRVYAQGDVPVSMWGDGGGQVLYGPYAGGEFPQTARRSLLNDGDDILALALIDSQLSAAFDRDAEDQRASANEPGNVISGGYVLMAPNRHGVFFEEREPNDAIWNREDIAEFRTDVVHVGGSR